MQHHVALISSTLLAVCSPRAFQGWHQLSFQLPHAPLHAHAPTHTQALAHTHALAHARAPAHTHTQVLSLCWQICSAVEYMHGQGVLHGDLKASNVMLASAPTTDSGAAPEHADLGLVGLPLSGLSSSGGGKPKGSFQAKLADFGNSR